MFGMLGFGLALLLLSLGFGYIICLVAGKEKENGFLKNLGFVVGIFLMVVSVYLLIDTVAAVIKMKQAMPAMMRNRAAMQSMPGKANSGGRVVTIPAAPAQEK